MRGLKPVRFAFVALALMVMGTLSVPSLDTAVAQDGCDYPSGTLQIMAPAAPGGGWDTTAREVQRVLQEEVTDQTVEVFNVEGAGGTIGLAQLVNDNAGDDHVMMMMGMVMIGAIGINQAEVSLETVTPIARLTAEFEVIVVPADSEFQTLDDLLNAFKADPAGVSWAGGSAGGTDHILIGLIAQAVGVDPTAVNYVAYSGGGEALAAILGGQVSAGVSGLGEFRDQIIAGELRALAVSGTAAGDVTATPTADQLTIPTLKDQGVDVELANWRGIVGPPDLTDEQRDCAAAMLQAMHDSDGWQNVLATQGWQDYFLAGADFAEFLPGETERINGILRGLGLIE